MAWIHGYGCTTAAGSNGEALFAALLEGVDKRSWVDTSGWPGQERVKEPQRPRAFLWRHVEDSSGSVRDVSHAAAEAVFRVASGARARLGSELRRSWSEARAGLAPPVLQRLREGSHLGVILASTKSFVDDFIWQEPSAEAERQLASDAFGPLLDDFLQNAELRPARRVCLSNACASSLSALAMAEEWLNNSDLSEVLVMAADTVGPFVIRGFETLRVLTQDAVRSFAKERSGFHLGEAAAAVLLSKERPAKAAPFLRGVGIDAEGFAVTRPSQSGESLRRACLKIPDLIQDPPDLIVAHGTGTQVNDQIEDHVYDLLFGSLNRRPLITGTKWCVGHTLGACGAIDLIAAIKILEAKRVFHLEETATVAPEFKNPYLVADAPRVDAAGFTKVMISSLGFGGIHAAALVEWKI